MITIREAIASDCDAIEACAHAAYQVYIDIIGKAPAPMQADFNSHIAAAQVIVMLNIKQLVGYAVYTSKDDDIQLENIAIDPVFQSQGLGRRLIESIHALAREKGYKAVALYTNEKMTENLDWYNKLGYTETDRRHEDGFDRVYFRKQI